ncbi:MAG: hypothetical protein IH920_04795, partial [Chloroflexi bacterium]|nr:hypothetical protein [Chloroflexota bacterium]
MKVAQGADGTPTRVTLTDLLRYFAWLGTYGFGGPIATVGGTIATNGVGYRAGAYGP